MDGDACPVRDEAFRVAARHGLGVTVVSNGSRGVRLPDGVRRVIVAEGPDAADDWIAEAIRPGDICVTADIPLASRCLQAGGHAVAPGGRIWDQENIGGALAGREVSRHMREMGHETRHAGFTTQNRSRFLEAMEAVVQRAMRGAPKPPPPMPDFFSD
ncbi:YaiI/YqxD family protein [Pararoseomonas baculiformis]|uniref:YaiI/YqxD family protein n=1 Tax=Pararoseomonas baculiformis TaxID=2820812 RepID=UPI00315896A6